jgi:hypothetical protein
MNDLKSYVDNLFTGYEENNQIRELKDEILSNLEARVADLISNGMEYNQAVIKATENIDSVDYLIEDVKKVYINRLKIEFLQVGLLYSLIAWIITIPLKIVGIGVLLNFNLLLIVAVLGIIFLVLNSKKEISYLHKTSVLNNKSAMRNKKLSWLICGLFITVSTLRTTAIYFGSNIWFSRPIRIDGPYQLAEVGIGYALPFISIIIPLLFSAYLRLLQKYEWSEQNEN